MNKTIACAVLAAALASCGKSTTPAGTAASSASAFVRVVNGSPDIETVNPFAPPGAPGCNFGSTIGGLGTLISAQVDGTQASASFPYQAVSTYIAVAPGAANIAVVAPGGLQTGCPSLTFTTPPLAAGSYQTVVVAGAYQTKTLKFLVFSDPGPSSKPGVQIDNAAPTAGTIGFGTFVPGTTHYQSAGSVAFGKTAPVPSASAPPGLAYFAGPAALPVAAIAPSQIDTYDANDVLPFGNYGHLSLFVIDPPLGSTNPGLIGGFY